MVATENKYNRLKNKLQAKFVGKTEVSGGSDSLRGWLAIGKV